MHPSRHCSEEHLDLTMGNYCRKRCDLCRNGDQKKNTLVELLLG